MFPNKTQIFSSDFGTALINAIKKQDIAFLSTHIKKGTIHPQQHISDGHNLLHAYVIYNKGKVMSDLGNLAKVCVQYGLDINEQTDFSQMTVFHYIVDTPAHGYKINVLKELYDLGADPTRPNCDHQSPYHTALKNKDIETASAILNLERDWRDKQEIIYRHGGLSCHNRRGCIGRESRD